MRLTAAFVVLFAFGCSAPDAQAEPPGSSPQERAKKPEARSGTGATPVAAPAACDRPGLPQTGLKVGAIVIETEPRPTRLEVELCLTGRERQIGMMCRTKIDDDKGMLFVFPDMRPRSFWMKNTLIPLDMVFLDDEGRIVGIVHEAEPLTLSSRRVPHPAQYVLEIGAGRAKELDLREGMWTRIEGLPPEVPGPAARPGKKQGGK